MAKENKTIGRVPVSRHEYADGATYYKDNIVTRYGSAFQCTAESTTTPPATLDGDGNIVLGDGWIFFADASESRKVGSRVSVLEQVPAQAIVELEARIKALEDSRGLLGDATAGTIDVKDVTKCLYPLVMRAHGVPAEANVPENLPEGLPWDGIPAFVGQLYINLDAASGGLYYAAGHDSVNDWKQA